MAAKIPSTKRPSHRPHTSKSASKSTSASRKPSSSTTSKPRSSSTSKSKSKTPRPAPTQQKTKPNNHNPLASKPLKRKPPRYTDKQLALPAVNSIIPAGVVKPRGKKRDKIFVDDQESMMTILALVNAEQEGKIESKMTRLRDLERIREARASEMERRKEGKEEEFKGKVREVKGKRRGSGKGNGEEEEGRPTAKARKAVVGGKKRVSFA